jgi:GntR family histidine utilization transcriptional repressor
MEKIGDMKSLEVRLRGHPHPSELHQRERSKADDPLAFALGIKRGQLLFHSIIVHFENEVPVQVEDRWVNPDVAPDYMQQDFSAITRNEYLMAAAPLQGLNYNI